MKLYEFAAIYHEPRTKKHDEEGREPEHTLVVDVTRVLAKDEKTAAMMAARAIPPQYADRLDRVEIAIRPF